MLQIRQKKIYLNISLVILVLILVTGAYYLGYRKGSSNPQIIMVQGVTNLTKDQPQGIDFDLFWNAWQLLKDKYVGADKLSNQDLVNGAISGLVGATKDPYSVFLPPADAQQFNQNISGEFSGIGAEIGAKDNQIMVVAPLKNSPAQKSGLKAGDAILKIDDTATTGMMVDDAVKLIRGPKGTTVKLTIIRKNVLNPLMIAIVRQTIEVPTIDWEIKNGNIAYIHLYNFYDKAPYLFYQAVLKIAVNNPRGIILDLRDNPGGYLDAGINIAGWFLRPGDIVVKEQFRSGEPQVYRASGPGLFKDIPLVVLINQGSASASEILTGALRDDRGVQTVGAKSFGKGTVQELDNLKGGSLIKITIAHWLTPKGQLIDKNGIEPNYKIDLTDDDVRNGRDPQLDKALEMIKNKISQSKAELIFQLQNQ